MIRYFQSIGTVQLQGSVMARKADTHEEENRKGNEPESPASKLRNLPSGKQRLWTTERF